MLGVTIGNHPEKAYSLGGKMANQSLKPLSKIHSSQNPASLEIVLHDVNVEQKWAGQEWASHEVKETRCARFVCCKQRVKRGEARA